VDVVELVEKLLARAQSARASDIHFEPTPDEMLVRLRLDGVLRTVATLPAAQGQTAVTRLKVMGGLLTYRNDIPQEGRLESPGAGVLQRRLAVFPTIHGQRAIVRQFLDDPQLDDLDGLGLREEIVAELRRLSRGQGVLLVTGPAGSGKSTTLGALLRHVVDSGPGRSVVALEDPVERRLAGVTQVQIDAHGAMDFPMALRSLLRQDPEVLMVGEIRDAQTARIVIEAGLTGHLLMSTLHSGSPETALLRLLEMGIEPYQVTSSVTAVLNQRLVRRLCHDCRRPVGGGRYEPVGCDGCLGTGFRGRAALAEMLRVDEPTRRALLSGADASQLRALLRAQGQVELVAEARRMVDRGITSAAEVAVLTTDERRAL
jgi:type II secretory ATPase GspE/PulE/Tfp pilus assembly ATPase PilB-like protein